MLNPLLEAEINRRDRWTLFLQVQTGFRILEIEDSPREDAVDHVHPERRQTACCPRTSRRDQNRADWHRPAPGSHLSAWHRCARLPHSSPSSKRRKALAALLAPHSTARSAPTRDKISHRWSHTSHPRRNRQPDHYLLPPAPLPSIPLTWHQSAERGSLRPYWGQSCN